MPQDGMGTPDPDPKTFSKPVFLTDFRVDLTFV